MLSLPRHHPVSNGADEDNDADQIAETVPAMDRTWYNGKADGHGILMISAILS